MIVSCGSIFLFDRSLLLLKEQRGTKLVGSWLNWRRFHKNFRLQWRQSLDVDCCNSLMKGKSTTNGCGWDSSRFLAPAAIRRRLWGRLSKSHKRLLRTMIWACEGC